MVYITSIFLYLSVKVETGLLSKKTRHGDRLLTDRPTANVTLCI